MGHLKLHAATGAWELLEVNSLCSTSLYLLFLHYSDLRVPRVQPYGASVCETFHPVHLFTLTIATQLCHKKHVICASCTIVEW